MQVRQRLVVPADRLESMEIMTAAYNRVNTGTLFLTLTDADEKVVAEAELDLSQVQQNFRFFFLL